MNTDHSAPSLLSLLRLVLAASLLALSSSCASLLTTWHDQAYTPVVDLGNELVEPAAETGAIEETSDLASSADELYSQGYVLVGYAKFSHTLVPSFQAKYAQMYGKRIGAARILQEQPRQDSNVYGYTVTYWAKGKRFPFGAYYNDLPDETALYFPDSLREVVGEGNRPVLVEAVVYDTPAEVSGLKKGELIVAVDGAPIAGTDDLDARIADCARQEVTLTVWGLSGLRETTCVIGERFVCADGYGTEGLYYNRPWQFDDYQNFQQYSEAFTQAWHDGIAAYEAAQVQAQRDAQVAYLSSEVGRLEGRIGELERAPSRRDDRTRLQQMVADAEEADRLGKNDWLKDM